MLQDHYQGKRVLVTGHTGFKGAWLSLWLKKLGAEVIGVSLDIPSEPSLFDITDFGSQMDHRVEDIRNYSKLKRLFEETQPQIVFHLAAQSLVRNSYDEPITTFGTNLMGTAHVLEAIRQSPSTQAAVIVTTDKCYENLEIETGYRETDRLGGSDPYSASKACAEIAFHSYFRSYFKGKKGAAAIASARAGNVIGGGDWAKDRIIPDCVRSWIQNKPPIIRNPKSTRPWQHVLDPLGGYLLLGTRLLEEPDRFSGESFNFGPNEDAQRDVETLISKIQNQWSLAKEVGWEHQPLEDGKKESKLLSLNIDKAKRELSWNPVLNFDQTVELTTSWYRSYYAQEKKKNAESIVQLVSEQIEDFQQRGC